MKKEWTEQDLRAFAENAQTAFEDVTLTEADEEAADTWQDDGLQVDYVLRNGQVDCVLRRLIEADGKLWQLQMTAPLAGSDLPEDRMTARERELCRDDMNHDFLTGVFNRLARSCFYGVAVKEGDESPYRNGCIPAGAASDTVVEAAQQAALAFEQAMYKFETHRALAVCDDYLRAANKRWSDASKAANKLEGEPANAAMTQALVDAFTELRVATVLMHGIVPAGCELICEYFDVDPVAFFSWDNIFASTDEFVEILGEKPGEHRVKPLPPRFDFFSKHESQY